jgi:lysozyme
MRALADLSAATTLEHLTVAQLIELQNALNALGYGILPDGFLGPVTDAVWSRFQADNGLDLGDSVDPATVALIEARTGATHSDIPLPALLIVKNFEGFRAMAYDDGTGVWTIGYGTTIYPDGKHVEVGETVTETQASAYLTHDLDAALATLAATVPYWSAMNPTQRSALISFGYNLGAGFYNSAGFNSISSALRDHRWSDVASVLPIYSDPEEPKVHPGLLRRRLAEAELWLGKGPFAPARLAGPTVV